MAPPSVVELSIFFLGFLHLVSGQNLECGSLITYRQHSVILSAAPQCFRNGCSAGNTTSTATTISSPCPVDAPCNRLWDIIRGKFEKDWCKSCHSDIACRIGGWPILNMTEACNVVPGDWIFAGNGGCCSSGDEPFQIADWINTLCNGSEWRAPFTFYGGMAKEDWEEWIEPWNWTLRPLNTSMYNITTDPGCNASAFLLTLGIENFVRGGTVCFYVLLALFFESKFKKPKFPWYRAIGGGLLEFMFILGGSIGASFTVKNTPGYQETPVGELILLLSSRPSVLGFLCAIGIIAIVFEDGRWYPNTYMTLYAANTAAGLAFSEAFQQIVGSIYLGRTANVGRKKDFFHVGHLTPFWHGSEAQRMYAGGLIFTILSPLTILGFLGIAFLQVHRLYIEPRTYNPGRTSKLVRWTLRMYLTFMNNFYANKWQRQDDQARQQQEMADAPRSTDRLQRGDVQPEEQQDKPRHHRGTGSSSQAIRIGQGESGLSTAEDATQMETQQKPGLFSRLSNRQPFLWVKTTTSDFLTSRQLNWFVTVPYMYVFAHDIRAQNQPMNPTGLEAITRHVRTKYSLAPTSATSAPLVQPSKDIMRDFRIIITTIMLMVWTVDYISQWLFWSGFVQSSGPRWCPPNNELTTSKLRIILSVLSWFGITFNFGINLQLM